MGERPLLPTAHEVTASLNAYAAAYRQISFKLTAMMNERDALRAENASLRQRLDHLTMITVDPESGPPGPEDTIHV